MAQLPAAAFDGGEEKRIKKTPSDEGVAWSQDHQQKAALLHETKGMGYGRVTSHSH
jgi:hypothetical protein